MNHNFSHGCEKKFTLRLHLLHIRRPASFEVRNTIFTWNFLRIGEFFFLFLQQILVEALHTPLKISIIRRPRAIEGNTYYLWCLIICDYLNSDYLWLLEHMYKSKFGLSVTYLKSMVTDNPKTQKRIMGKNNSEVSLSDVDYDQISLSRLEDQKYEICCTWPSIQ